MKIMDEKGKLFGVINIVDLIVLIVVIAIALAAVARLTSSKLNSNGASPLDEKKDLYVTVYSSTVVPEVAANLKVGDKLVANNKITDAEIVSVTSKQADYLTVDSDGNPILAKHPLWKDVVVVIKDKAKESDVILKAGEQEVRTNYSYIVKTQTVEVNGRIRGVSFDEPAQTLINGIDGDQIYKGEAETAAQQ